MKWKQWDMSEFERVLILLAIAFGIVYELVFISIAIDISMIRKAIYKITRRMWMSNNPKACKGCKHWDMYGIYGGCYPCCVCSRNARDMYEESNKKKLSKYNEETCETCWHYDIRHFLCDDRTEHDPNEAACESWEDANDC